MRRGVLACAGAAAIAATTAGLAHLHAQSPVRGIFNWIHGTGDAERAFAFYQDVFGIELARSPFAGAPGTPFGLELSEFFDIGRSDRAPRTVQKYTHCPSVRRRACALTGCPIEIPA